LKPIFRQYELVCLISVILVLPAVSNCQSKDNIEFSFFTTYNKQAEYPTQYGNVAVTNDLKLYGVDLGFTLDYKRLLYGKTFILIGLGYMGFGVSKIGNQTGVGNTSISTNARPINYPSTVFILYSTTSYYYNNLIFHIGLERQFDLSRISSFVVGLDYYHANILSEKYFISDPQTYYNTANQGSFGDFLNLKLGVSEKLGDFSFSPALILPIYKSWRKDVIFRENPNSSVNSWASGIGIMISFSYH